MPLITIQKDRKSDSEEFSYSGVSSSDQDNSEGGSSPTRVASSWRRLFISSSTESAIIKPGKDTTDGRSFVEKSRTRLQNSLGRRSLPWKRRSIRAGVAPAMEDISSLDPASAAEDEYKLEVDFHDMFRRDIEKAVRDKVDERFHISDGSTDSGW
jgi:hypothetical protein